MSISAPDSARPVGTHRWGRSEAGGEKRGTRNGGGGIIDGEGADRLGHNPAACGKPRPRTCRRSSAARRKPYCAILFFLLQTSQSASGSPARYSASGGLAGIGWDIFFRAFSFSPPTYGAATATPDRGDGSHSRQAVTNCPLIPGHTCQGPLALAYAVTSLLIHQS